MRLIIEAVRIERATLWADLIVNIVPLFRDGDTLRQTEALWLADWLKTIGREDLDLEEVQTVQVPRDWAAGVLGGHAQSATRALQAIQVSGVLTLINKGIKGHASLYCVNPLPAPRIQTLTTHTCKCDGKYPHTLGKYPHTLEEIPSHHNSVTWEDTT